MAKELVFIDIETVPTSAAWFLEYAASKHQTNPYVRSDKVEWWDEEGQQEAIDEEVHKGGLNGITGEVVAIAVAHNHEEPKVFSRSLEEPEAPVLMDAFNYMRRDSWTPTFVGYNILRFDLRFLHQRQLMLGLPYWMHLGWAADAAPWQKDRAFDLQNEIFGFRNTPGSFDMVCQALGFDGKGDIDGSQVWQYMKEGRHNEVAEYCKDDVAQTQKVYYALFGGNGGNNG